MVNKLLILLFTLLFACPASAETGKVMSEGSALIEGNIEKAKSAAFDDACQSAVRTSLIKLYGADVVKQNELLLMKVYKQAKTSFIVGSQIISEKESGADTYNIKLEVDVDEDALREFIAEKGISLSGQKILSILPLIVERTSADGKGEYWWGKENTGIASKRSLSDIEKALAKYLSRGNFTLVDPYTDQLASNIPESYKYMELKTAELVQLGKLFATGLVASGYVWTDCSKSDLTNKNACETTLSLQVISSDMSKIVAAKRAHEKAEASDVQEARTVSRAKACQTVSDSLVYQLSRRWDKRPATNFRIVIKGIKDFANYTKTKNCLSGITGLNNVVDRYQSSGQFVFEGDKRGGSADIHQMILSKCFPGGATVVEQNEDHVEISI